MTHTGTPEVQGIANGAQPEKAEPKTVPVHGFKWANDCRKAQSRQ